jgi:hypothetical protein
MKTFEATERAYKNGYEQGYKDALVKDNNVPSKWIPVTKADRIRAMSDEELAWELMTWRIETEAKHHGVSSDYPNTQKTILEWLQQPVEVE